MVEKKFSIYIYRDTIARKCPTIYEPSSSTVKLSVSIDAFQQSNRHSNSQWQYTWQMTGFLIVPT